MDLRNVFATNLRRLRRERGLSQEALAYESGVDRAYLSRIEKGEPSVGIDVIARLAAALEVDPSLLLKARRSDKRKRGPRSIAS